MPTITAERRKAYQSRREALRSDRVGKGWDSHWQDLADFAQPRRARFFSDRSNDGSRLNNKIVNGTATWGLRTLASGMQAGITSPARPWFHLTVPDAQLAEVGSVRWWLQKVEDAIRAVLQASNIYNALHTLYGDLALFGTGVIVLDEDLRSVIRAFCVPPGEYCLATNARGEVDTLYHDLVLTVAQLVDRFGLENCSDRVQELHRTGKLDERIEVLHVIEPRQVRAPGKVDRRNMPWASVWMECASTDDRVLDEGGYQECPILAPRWDVTSGDVYGRSPGMDALGDIKALQVLERRKAQALEKIVDPPMQGPPGLRNRPASLVPGMIAFLDGSLGTQKLEPAVVVPPQVLAAITEAIQEHEQRIKENLLADVWLMLAQREGAEPPTAREVEELHQEKMLQLGPVMTRLENELLKLLIERVFGILYRSGVLPPPPPELQGQEIKAEFVSIMATAQRMVSASAIDQFLGFIGRSLALNPNIVDKVDFDEAADQYAEALGLNVAIVRPDDQVAALRAQKAKQAQQMAQMQQAMAAAQTGKTLSETDTEGDNALTRLTGPVAGASAGSLQ